MKDKIESATPNPGNTTLEIPPNPLPDRKIIGYRCPMDLYGGYTKSGDIWIQDEYNDGIYIHQKSRNTGRTLPAEIVEKWEPVYEEELKPQQPWYESETAILVSKQLEEVQRILNEINPLLKK